jgi:glutathione-independent formaldehyde dehydrogenase
VTEDPGATDEASKQGSLKIRFGLGWAKSHSFHTGQTPVMKYHRQLMNAILNDKINIAKAVNAEVISLKDTKVMLNLVWSSQKFVIDPHGMIV